MAVVKCGNCGAEIEVTNHGEMQLPAFNDNTDRCVGILPTKTKGDNMNSTIDFSKLTAAEKAEVLKAMGYNPFEVDSNLKAETPAEQKILDRGNLRSDKNFRVHLTAQMFRLLGWERGITKSDSWTKNVNNLNYYYQFDMLVDRYYDKSRDDYKYTGELPRIAKLEKSDYSAFIEATSFFNKEVVSSLLVDYAEHLKKFLNSDKVEHHMQRKVLPYITFKGENTYTYDIHKKYIKPVMDVAQSIRLAKDYTRVYEMLYDFIHSDHFFRIKIDSRDKNCLWVNAFKGAGAYYSLYNLTQYDGLELINYETGELIKGASANKEYFKQEAVNCHGQYYKLLALLKKSLRESKFNFLEVCKETYK